MSVIVIKCLCGTSFSAVVADYVDAEWKLQEAYYKAQGCLVEEQEQVNFGKCDCDHSKSLEHEFESLIEEVRNEG